MSSATHDGHHDESFHVHITPFWVYMVVFGALMVCTVLTVLAAQVPLEFLGEQKRIVGLILAMAIALVKATLVALIFMHLWFDNKFYTLLFILSLIFLAVFIVFCMFDIHYRNEVNPISNNMVEANKPSNNGDFQLQSFITDWKKKTKEDVMISEKGTDKTALSVIHGIDQIHHAQDALTKQYEKWKDEYSSGIPGVHTAKTQKGLEKLKEAIDAMTEQVSTYKTAFEKQKILMERIKKLAEANTALMNQVNPPKKDDKEKKADGEKDKNDPKPAQ